jgi:hypothetical protein
MAAGHRPLCDTSAPNPAASAPERRDRPAAPGICCRRWLVPLRKRARPPLAFAIAHPDRHRPRLCGPVPIRLGDHDRSGRSGSRPNGPSRPLARGIRRRRRHRSDERPPPPHRAKRTQVTTTAEVNGVGGDSAGWVSARWRSVDTGLRNLVSTRKGQPPKCQAAPARRRFARPRRRRAGLASATP